MFTVPNYKSASHQLVLDSAFAVIDSINLNYGYRPIEELESAPKVMVYVNLTIYTSKKAYDEKAQPLHNRSVSFQQETEDLDAVKAAIPQELSK